MDSIRFVTTNAAKLEAAQEAFQDHGIAVRQATAELTEPQTIDVEDVARQAAEQAMDDVPLPFFVADTGYLAHTLDGFPGALLKPVMDSIGPEGLCRLMEDEDDRRSTYRSVAAYAGTDGEIRTFICDDRGRMAQDPDGDRRDDWGSVMRLHIPDGFDQTLAAMPEDTFAEYRAGIAPDSHYRQLADWVVERSR